MGMGLFAYSVDIDPLRAAFGSNDSDLSKKLEEHFADLFTQDENSLERDPKYRDESWFNDSMTYRQALKNFISGTVSINEETAGMYFFLVEQLCEYFGERLYSDLWERLASDKLMRTIDAYFTRKGVAENIRFNGIMTDRNVDPLEWDHDGIGFIENWQVKWVLQRLDPLDVMGLDKEAALGIITIYNWLKKADEAGRGLVFVCG